MNITIESYDGFREPSTEIMENVRSYKYFLDDNFIQITYRSGRVTVYPMRTLLRLTAETPL
jgi:hypothetical protein